MALHSKRTLATIETGVTNRTNFKVGNVSGKWAEKGHIVHTGKLPYKWANQLNSVIMDDRVFVVYSYATPIAWYISPKSDDVDFWVEPDVSYSRTTNNHQSVVNRHIRHLVNS
jgi:hypothetical protein